MHNHWCAVVGHEYECNDQSCVCVCDQLMEEGDHADCPIELRACPEHPEGGVHEDAEPDANAVQIDFSFMSQEGQQSSPNCKCGCADLETSVGFCLWCGHQYVNYNPETEDDHFANHCPNAPEQLKESARQVRAKHKR
jgi:hypothetical protein